MTTTTMATIEHNTDNDMRILIRLHDADWRSDDGRLYLELVMLLNLPINKNRTEY